MFPFSTYSRPSPRTYLEDSQAFEYDPLSGFGPLSGLLLGQPPGHFQTGALLGFSLQGFPLSRRCSNSSLLHCPRDVSPSAGHPSPRKKGLRARFARHSRYRDCVFDRPQGLTPLESPFATGRLFTSLVGRSPHGFSLFRVFHPRRGLTSQAPLLSFCDCRCAREPMLRRIVALQSLTRPRTYLLSLEMSSPSEVSAAAWPFRRSS